MEGPARYDSAYLAKYDQDSQLIILHDQVSDIYYSVPYIEFKQMVFEGFVDPQQANHIINTVMGFREIYISFTHKKVGTVKPVADRTHYFMSRFMNPEVIETQRRLLSSPEDFDACCESILLSDAQW